MKTKTIRVLFSIDVVVAKDNPSNMKEGPGPWMFGFLEDDVNNSLSNAFGMMPASWKDIGDFKLHSVTEVPKYG